MPTSIIFPEVIPRAPASRSRPSYRSTYYFKRNHVSVSLAYFGGMESVTYVNIVSYYKYIKTLRKLLPSL